MQPIQSKSISFDASTVRFRRGFSDKQFSKNNGFLFSDILNLQRRFQMMRQGERKNYCVHDVETRTEWKSLKRVRSDRTVLTVKCFVFVCRLFQCFQLSLLVKEGKSPFLRIWDSHSGMSIQLAKSSRRFWGACHLRLLGLPSLWRWRQHPLRNVCDCLLVDMAYCSSRFEFSRTVCSLKLLHFL